MAGQLSVRTDCTDITISVGVVEIYRSEGTKDAVVVCTLQELYATERKKAKISCPSDRADITISLEFSMSRTQPLDQHFFSNVSDFPWTAPFAMIILDMTANYIVNDVDLVAKSRKR